MRLLLSIAAALALFAGSAATGRAEAPPAAAAATQTATPALPAPETTEHSITVAGRRLSYQARAGALSLPGTGGAVAAEIFHVAYSLHAEAPGDGRQRPITFVFNG